MNTYTAWTRVEENILKEFYGRAEYTMDRLQELLPNRSAGAIQNRAKALGLLDPAKRLLQEAKAQAQEQYWGQGGMGEAYAILRKTQGRDPKSIEALEIELNLRKLELEVQTAERQLGIFEQNAIAKKTVFSDELVKERSKLTSRVSQLRLRLFKFRLEHA